MICGELFCICSRCDHGQTSCPEHQFKKRRHASVQASRRLHARSAKGRERARERKLRQRTREHYQVRGEQVPEWAQIRATPRPPTRLPRTTVTDTGIAPGGSPFRICRSIIQPVPSVAAGQQPREERPKSPRSAGQERRPCSFCRRLCGPFFRFGPKGRSPSVRVFRRATSAASGEIAASTRPP